MGGSNWPPTPEKTTIKKSSLIRLRYRTELFQKSFLPFTIGQLPFYYWNKLDPEVRNVEKFFLRSYEFHFLWKNVFIHTVPLLILCCGTWYFTIKMIKIFFLIKKKCQKSVCMNLPHWPVMQHAANFRGTEKK